MLNLDEGYKCEQTHQDGVNNNGGDHNFYLSFLAIIHTA